LDVIIGVILLVVAWSAATLVLACRITDCSPTKPLV